MPLKTSELVTIITNRNTYIHGVICPRGPGNSECIILEGEGDIRMQE